MMDELYVFSQVSQFVFNVLVLWMIWKIATRED